jgi:hypothetical protein
MPASSTALKVVYNMLNPICGLRIAAELSGTG